MNTAGTTSPAARSGAICLLLYNAAVAAALTHELLIVAQKFSPYYDEDRSNFGQKGPVRVQQGEVLCPTLCKQSINLPVNPRNPFKNAAMSSIGFPLAPILAHLVLGSHWRRLWVVLGSLGS